MYSINRTTNVTAGATDSSMRSLLTKIHVKCIVQYSAVHEMFNNLRTEQNTYTFDSVIAPNRVARPHVDHDVADCVL